MKDTGDVESPDLIQTTEAQERTPLVDSTKTMEDEMVPIKVVGEMVEMLSGLVHGEDTLGITTIRISIMQLGLDKVIYL